MGHQPYTKRNPTEKEFRDFILQLTRLESIEFLGVLNILSIQLFDRKNLAEKEESPRNFDEILSEALDKFIQLSANKRKNIMKIMKQANSQKEKIDKKILKKEKKVK